MPPDQPTLKTRLAHALFGDIIQTAVAEATAAISVRVDDTPGWNRLAPAGPHACPESSRMGPRFRRVVPGPGRRPRGLAQELSHRPNISLTDVRSIVTLAHSYVLWGSSGLGMRYANWLQDRVRLNRFRTRQLLLEIGPTEVGC